MNQAYSKKPTGVGLLACVEQGLLTSAGGYVTVEVRSRTDGKILDPAKILRKCKNMAQPHLFCNRRSFRAVGESCVTNLIPDPKPSNVHNLTTRWPAWHPYLPYHRANKGKAGRKKGKTRG